MDIILNKVLTGIVVWQMSDVILIHYYSIVVWQMSDVILIHYLQHCCLADE